MNTALKKAANKVKIKLILAGISDVTLSRRATHHIYATLLDNNIELYEWDKTVLHGKAAVVDGIGPIGSFNLNNLSSYGSLK
jgi:cardiolipin synthase